MPQKDQFEGFTAMVQMKYPKAETLMPRDGIAGTPRLDAPGAHSGHDKKAGDRTVRAGTGESALSAHDPRSAVA